jgi:hypothetical protein
LCRPGAQLRTFHRQRRDPQEDPGRARREDGRHQLRQELELAKLYNPQSGVEISGTLLKNNIDAGGISTNAGQIEARFVVTANGQVRFDKVKRTERKWDSSFSGAVAIPLAANNYPLMVQSLVAALVTDPDFVKAIRN